MGTTGFEQRIPTWTMGDRLVKARRDTGMSTREFADALGVSAKMPQLLPKYLHSGLTTHPYCSIFNT